MTIEEELRKEQSEMQKVVQEKQKVIEVQEQRLRTLDSANAKLLHALADLKEHASNSSAGSNIATDNSNNNSSTLDGRRPGSNGASRNGMTGPIRAKLPPDFAGYKSSTC